MSGADEWFPLEPVEVAIRRPWGTVAYGTHGSDPAYASGWVVIEAGGELVADCGVTTWCLSISEARALAERVAATADNLDEACLFLGTQHV